MVCGVSDGCGRFFSPIFILLVGFTLPLSHRSARYLAGEMRKADIASDPLEPLDQDSAENEELAVLREKCMKRDRAGKLDGYA